MRDEAEDRGARRRLMYVRAVPIAQINGAEIYFESHGEGAPLLLIPGFDFGVWSFYRQVPTLAEHMRVIAFEPRGVGRSSEVPKSFSVADMAADAEALLDHLGLEQVDALGFSMGGFIAFELALGPRARVSRLVAVSTHYGGPKALHGSPAVFSSMAKLASEGGGADFSLYFSDAAIADRPELGAEFTRLREANPTRAGSWMQRVAALMSYDVRTRLAALDIPVLIAVGEADEVVPAGNAKLLTQHLRHARVEAFGGGRHLVHIEHSERFNQLVIDFLARSS